MMDDYFDKYVKASADRAEYKSLINMLVEAVNAENKMMTEVVIGMMKERVGNEKRDS
jgi:hypothetical protein